MTRDEYQNLHDEFVGLYPDSCLAVNVKRYPDMREPPIGEGNQVMKCASALFCGTGGDMPDWVFEVFPICGCGDPDRTVRIYHKALEWCVKDVALLAARGRDWTDNDDLFMIVMYVLNNIGLAEHGSSIYGSWLTAKGKLILKLLNEYLAVS